MFPLVTRRGFTLVERLVVIAIVAVPIGRLLPAVHADEAKTISGRVLDVGGKPVAEADVAPYWHVADGKVTPSRGTKTDAAGQFTYELAPRSPGFALLAYDKDRQRGGLLVADPKQAPEKVEIKLGPLVHVHGQFSCKELGQRPPWTMVYMTALPGRARVFGYSSRQAEFSFRLPPGQYQFWGYGTDVQDRRQEMTLAADRPDVDLGTVDLPATVIARHVGKAPPEWTVTDARGVSKDVKLEDFKGKWVLIDFWGFWCGPCIGRSLPALMDLYDAHRDHRDQFEILAFHDARAKDFQELDEKLKRVIQDRWRGKPLPFPILLDATGQTIKDFGVRSFPTAILIDPEGKLVGNVSDHALEEKLPALPVAERVTRALNRDIGYGFDAPALSVVTKSLGIQARIDIRFGEGALKAAGVTPETTVPLTLSGSVSLRSWLDLVLSPFDLTFERDEKGLVIVYRKGGPDRAGEPSEAQRYCAQRIEGRLDEKVSFDLRDKTLSQMAQFFKNLTGENFVLDPVARRAGRLDPKATVTGSGKDVPLRDGLKQLLDRLGLRAAVRDEVVVLTVK